jgi:Uma2 family endonuclease
MADSEHKYEYLGGPVRMLAGGKAAHNRIIRNCNRSLDGKSDNCEVFLSDTAVSIYPLDKIYFPDLSAVCGEAANDEEEGIERIKNPTLIIEVLSKETATIDRGEKFQAYWQLPSVEEYVMIDSLSYLVETYYRETQDLWRIGNYYQLEQRVPFVTIGVTVPLSAIYEGVIMPAG